MLLEIALGVLLAALFEGAIRPWFGERTFVAYFYGIWAAALWYVGFALWRGGAADVLLELGGVAAFGLVAAAGRWRSRLWLAAGWAAHVGWDVFLHPSGAAGYAPRWYPPVCIGFDLALAVLALADWRRAAARRA